jgi:membrane protease YdiL (CAAX protease family)
MGNAYLELVYRGRTRSWRYVVAIAIILIFWLILGSLPYAFAGVVILLKGGRFGINSAGELNGLSPFINYILLSFSFVAFLAGIFIAMHWIHRRPLLTLITPYSQINWHRLGQGFTLWFLLGALITLGEALIYPGRYHFTLNLARFLPFAAVVLILTPIQTSTEELFFRGYVLQGMGLIWRNLYFLVPVSGLLFALPHFANPETSSGFILVMVYYFAFGAYMAWITLRDGRLELALGVHAANNLFAGLIANYASSALTTPSIFTSSQIDPVYNLLSWVAAALVFTLVIFMREERPAEDQGSLIDKEI